MKNIFQSGRVKQGLTLPLLGLLLAGAFNACKKEIAPAPNVHGISQNAVSSTLVENTCLSVDENRYILLGHLHQQARVTTKGVSGFADQLYTAADGVTVDAGPLRFTAPGNGVSIPSGEVEIGGGEGYGVTTQPLDGNTAKRKFINNGEKLVIRTRNTSDEILKAYFVFRGVGGTGDQVTVKALRGSECVGEMAIDLSTAVEGQGFNVCFAESFNVLEITAGASTEGVQVGGGTKFFVGKQVLDYDLCSAVVNWEAGALDRQNLAFPGTAASTEVCWQIQYSNADCNNTGNVYRYYLRRKDNNAILAGVAGNNGLRDPNRIFAYRRGGTNNAWANTVPFVLLRKYHGNSFRPAIATPNFVFGYPDQFNQATFVSPVSGTASMTSGVDTWTAVEVDHDANPLSAPRIHILKNGVMWGRTNGAGENGALTGLTVLKVRVANTDAAGKIANVYENVPFVLVQHPTKGLTLQTGTTSPAYGSGSLQFVGPIQQNLAF